MTKRILVAGHQGMVGSAIARQLSKVPNVELVTRTRAELDLSIQQDVADFFANEKIDEVYLGAAKVGSGMDCSIAELVSTIGEVTGFARTIKYDTSKPDGAPRKLMDNSKLRSLGWEPGYTLKEGLEDAYRWYVENIDTART